MSGDLSLRPRPGESAEDVLARVSAAAQRTRREPPPLNRMQLQVLGIIDAYGPVPPSEIARQLLIDGGSARSRCRSLEARGLIDAHYTSGHAGRAYTCNREGQDVLARAFGGNDDDVPVVVAMRIQVKAVRVAGETDEELLARLQSTSEWEDWDVIGAEVRA